MNIHIAKKKQNLIEFTQDIKLNLALISINKIIACMEMNVNICMMEQYIIQI